MKHQASKQITEKRLIEVVCVEDERGAIVRRMLDVAIRGKGGRGRPNLKWKYACKRGMTEAGLKDENTKDRAA